MPGFIILIYQDELDLLQYEDDTDQEESSSLPLPLKIIMLSLIMIALILVVFSASVGAICRIQCKVRKFLEIEGL